MKKGPLIGGAVVVASLAIGANAFVKNLTPYVSFEEARHGDGRTLQIVGALDKTRPPKFDGGLNFTLIEEKSGDHMAVRYKQSVPPNFNQAIQITAKGTYDGKTFQATQLLVKCPSKYQGTETETRDYSAKN